LHHLLPCGNAAYWQDNIGNPPFLLPVSEIHRTIVVFQPPTWFGTPRAFVPLVKTALAEDGHSRNRGESLMRKSGVKCLDDIRQIDWLVVSKEQCPDQSTQERLIACYFRIPHQSSGNDLTFVQEVTIRHSRRRILFYQESGVHLG